MGLKELSAVDFVKALSSKEPTPGGGSAGALVGAIGVGLLCMVATYIEDQSKVGHVFDPFEKAKKELLDLIDQDADSFDQYMKAIKMPKVTEEEKKERSSKMQLALVHASQVPLATMKACEGVIPFMSILEQSCKKGMISDLGASASCLKSAIESAYLNIIINAGSIKDTVYTTNLMSEAEKTMKNSIQDLNACYHRVVEILASPSS
jgi:formiminotetrahydrofolate cyclodeaminase